MKIKELENLLSISRSNIRFYEKEGLFSPERKDNNYRDYSDEDIEALKKIIVLRKMGFTVEEIKLIQNGELPYAEAMNKAQHRLEAEIEQLNGSLNIVKQASKNHSSFNEIDVIKYWDEIDKSEKSGEKFIDICKDYLKLELILFDNMWKWIFFYDFKKSRTKYGIIKACITLLLLCIIRGLGKVFIWHESFWDGFLYPWLLALAGSVFIIPLFILSKKAPKIAAIVADILIMLIILFFVGLFLLIVYGIINAIIS